MNTNGGFNGIKANTNGGFMGMSEESVDIHIRLSPDGARMLETLMAWGSFTSKSGYIEEMLMAIEDIFSAYYTHHELGKKANTEREKFLIYTMLSQYLLSPLRRLGWPGYRDERRAMESEAK